jgi:putative sterol carrier protein
MADEKNELGVVEFTDGIRDRIGENSGLDAVIKFAFDEGGVIFIDGKSVPNIVSNEDLPSDVTLKLSLDTMNKLYRKETNGMMAFMSGKIKLEGDMMVAMKVDQILG